MSYSLAAKLKNKTAGGVAAPAPLPTVKPVSPTPSDFLPRVLPAQGPYAAWTAKDKKNHNAATIDELATVIESLGDRTDIYYAVASFKAPLPDYEGRTQANVAMLRCFKLDLDAGAKKLETQGPAKVYVDREQALAAFQAFTQATGLTPSITVSSGEGLHVYYVLDADVTPDRWRPVATAFHKFCKGHGLKVDATVTKDHARVLRPVGTLHPNGRRVEVLAHTAKVYSLDEFAGIVRAGGGAEVELPALSGTGYDLSVNADILPQYDDTPADFELIRAECEAVRWAAEPANQPHVEEPYWRGLLGIVKHCTGAEELAHEVSRHHPEYDPDEVERKLEGWSAGPTTCEYFAEYNPDACSRCKHKSKIKTPIVLGRVAVEAKKADGATAALDHALSTGALQALVDQNGVLNYVETYQRDGRRCRSVFESGTVEAGDLILSTVSTSNGKPPSQQAIASVEARLRSAARRNGVFTKIHLRVARTEEATYHDLGPGRIVRIDPNGWQVVEEFDTVPLFRRGAGAGELPTPEPFHGDAREAFAHCLKHYRDLFGTPIHRAILAVAVLLDRLDPHTPHPIFERVGPPGSGKTTVTEHDTNMIDPPSGDSLRITGHRAEDIGAAAQQQYVLAMDNVSQLDRTTSDVLCIASTGGALTARQFQEQKKAVVLNIHRPVNIAAVNTVCHANDLQTRTVREEFGPREKGVDVISEDEMRALIRQRRPAFLGALYTLKAASLRVLPEVRQRKGWTHRMVAFDQTGEAMLTAAGYEAGAFLKIVGEMRDSMARRSASGDVFLMRLLDALRIVSGWPRDDAEPHPREVLQRPRPAAVFPTIQGTGATLRPGVLLNLLPKPDPWDKDRAIPKTERALMDALRRVQPTLRGLGISYRENQYNGRALACFEWSPDALDE
ncbi:MAG: hypothetical protein KGZ91_06445 [Afipia sp.]|nr:hypothetical protein [Afipia sp.]